MKLLPFFFARIILQPKVDAEFDFPLLKKGLNGNLDLPVSARAAKDRQFPVSDVMTLFLLCPITTRQVPSARFDRLKRPLSFAQYVQSPHSSFM